MVQKLVSGSMVRFLGVLLSAALAVSLGSGRIAAQGETCAAATTITAGNYAGTIAGATNDGSAVCGNSSTSPDKWYRYVATADGTLTVQTCGSQYDTVLSVHSSCPGTSANQLACNDDTCGLSSLVTLGITEGEDYLIRIAGYNGATGVYQLSVTLSDPTGECADPVDIGLGEPVTGTTVGQGDDGDSGCSGEASPDRIFRYFAVESCYLIAETCGSSYDTVISIHSSCPPTSGNQLSCNDDACGLSSAVGVDTEAGQTYWIRVGGFSGAAGAFTLALQCSEPPDLSDGPDITVTSTSGIRQYARLGDYAALSMQSTLCNIGSAPIEWRSNPNPRHPFLVFNAYRLLNDRLTQIGQSWAKHGFAASQTSGLCGLPCIPDGSGNLGSGCADIYGVGTNADQNTYGPRHEINPWTGAFTYAGSHLATASRTHDPIEHRLSIHDSDLNPETNAGAQYFAELYVVTHDDVEHTNSLGWQQFDVTGGAPRGSWTFNFRSSVSTVGSVLDVWPGATRTVLPGGELTTDGRCYLAAKAQDNGDGSFHYEYALFNLDMDRGVQAFTVAVPDSVSVSDIGFQAVRSDRDGYSNDAWTSSRGSGGVTWATQSFVENPRANPLRWGTLYNFWFDASAVPADAEVRITAYKPGGEAEHSGMSIGPMGESTLPEFKRGDADGDGMVDITDVVFSLDYLFRGGPAPGCFDAADVNDTDELDVSDPIGTLLWLFSVGFVPPAPGPAACGPDPTRSELPRCTYDPERC